MKLVKGQLAVENLAVLAGFLALIIPFTLFVMTSSSIYLKTSSDESLRSSLYLIKNSMEEAYAQCPYRREFTVRFGPNTEGINIINSGTEDEPKIEIVANTVNGNISVPVSIENHAKGNIKVFLNQGIPVSQLLTTSAKGNMQIYVQCDSAPVKFPSYYTAYYIDAAKTAQGGGGIG